MSKVVRSVKNVTKGYSTVQIKVRDATSNDAWGPTGAQMSEIAQMTFNGSNDFYEIMDMLDKRLNDKGKNWRHVLKSLKVLDYCLHEGSELVVTWARKNIYIIKTLREFQYVEDDSRDVGQNVRTSAKELTALIMDEERLRAERADRKSWKSRVTGIDEYGPTGSGLAGHGEGSQPQRRQEQRRPRADDENDLEMKLAIEASMNEAEEDKKRRQSHHQNADDEDLQKAIKLSKEEEELRRRELETQNAQSLFDDTPAPQPSQPFPTGYNQGYQQGNAVDLFGNPVYGQQPQNTGYLDSAYTSFQQQPTGFQNGFAQQPTGFSNNQQFQQQPQQLNFLQNQSTIQPQQTSFNNLNPYQNNNDYNQLQLQQQQQQQQQQQLSTGVNNPWAAQNNQIESLKPAPTGANNPFASKVNQPQPQAQNRQPTLNTLAEQRTVNQFNQQQSYPNPIMNYSAPAAVSQPQLQQPQQPQLQQLQQQRPQPQQELDPQRAKLNALLASGEGMDTFGNTGDLRIPAQHTAPGTFVNSAGQNLSKLHGAATGNNPFFSQNTGVPQQNFGQPGVVPAATGPAGMNGGFGYGQGSNNPFGSQQNQRNPAGGSLIDL